MTPTNPSRQSLWYVVLAVALAGSLGSALLMARSNAAPRNAPRGPLPTTTVKVPEGREVATLAAGCFWAMEAMYKQLKGVDKVEPGYAGGTVVNPSYEQVETGATGHAETIQITFDPRVISYRDLLQVQLIARNPTTLNFQPPDEGTEYRSVIFFHNEAQQQAAKEMIQKINAAHIWRRPIVTEVTPFSNFYLAEDYHFNYYNLHPNESYCKYVVAPEVANFRAKFKSKLKS